MSSKIENAISLFQEGKLKKSEEICLEILKIDSNNLNILHLLGIIYFKIKNYKFSIDFFEKAMKINAYNAEVNNNYGIVLKEIKKLDLALEKFNEAIKINPNYAEAYNNRGIIMAELRKLDFALENFNQATKINPNYAEAYNNAGFTLKDLKKLDLALEKFNEAIKINPNYAEAYNNRGITLKELDRLDEALESYKKAIEIKPNYGDALLNQGNIYKDLKQLDNAVKSYKKAIEINPDLDYLLGTLIFNKNALCEWKFYEKDLETLKNKINNNNKVTIPFYLLSIFDSLLLQKNCAKINVNDKFPNIKLLNSIPKIKKKEKIRIAYYSADFRDHPVSQQIIQFIELHDRSKFEIYGISFGPERNDKMKSKISSKFDKFIDVRLKSDKEIVKLSRDLEIDFAIDLMGFTRYNRFGIFVERCAPLQLSFIGYSGTIGAECIDYIIADKFLIPKESQKYYSEKIVYMPNSFMVSDSTKKISDKIFKREELGLPKDGFIFCCFNQSYKITPNVFDTWMRLLKNVNGSVLWLSEGNVTSQKNLKERAEKKGVESNRIIFAKKIIFHEY